MCHVLIIEDEVLVAMLIEDTLADVGATSFDIAATENEAVNAAILRPPAFITVGAVVCVIGIGWLVLLGRNK